jgi:hypothetical protein
MILKAVLHDEGRRAEDGRGGKRRRGEATLQIEGSDRRGNI